MPHFYKVFSSSSLCSSKFLSLKYLYFSYIVVSEQEFGLWMGDKENKKQPHSEI